MVLVEAVDLGAGTQADDGIGIALAGAAQGDADERRLAARCEALAERGQIFFWQVGGQQRNRGFGRDPVG